MRLILITGGYGFIDPQITNINNGRPDEIGKEKTFHWVNKEAQGMRRKQPRKGIRRAPVKYAPLS